MKNPEVPQLLWAAAPAVGVVASFVVGATLGIEVGILVLAGVVLVLVIFVLWNSVHALTGESDLTLEEALSLAAPSAEEEQKRAVLRTLKDLEYERSVGKISNDDYHELIGVYRAKAKALIQAVDASNEQSRQQAERLLAKRLAKLPKVTKKRQPKRELHERDDGTPSHSETPSAKRGAKPRAVAAEAPDSEALGTEPPDSVPPDSVPPDSEPPDSRAFDSEDTGESDASLDGEAAGHQRCPECTTHNEADARFCKRCGVTLEAAS